MTIIIIQFDNEISAQEKMKDYGKLANYSPLATIYHHSTLPIWFFSASACIDNGGLNKDAIRADVQTQDIFEIENYDELVTMGYWPEPEKIQND